MKYIKLVASDLDGTLLDKNKEITPRLYHALEQMNEQGIYFVPATGRPFSTVPQAIKALPFLRYVMTQWKKKPSLKIIFRPMQSMQ